MTTIYTLTGADFSATDLPNIYPFVASSELEFGYDFGNGVESLVDVSGNNPNAVAMRNDLSLSIREEDNSILVGVDDGLGTRLDMGYIDTNIPLRDTQLSDEFTIMLVGGYGGEAFPTDKVVTSGATICTLLDFGTSIGSSSFALEASEKNIGAKVNFGGQNLPFLYVGMAAIFLTRKDGSWTLKNMTSNEVITKTDLELGVTGVLAPNKSKVSNVVLGFYNTTTTLNGLPPTLYQAARWTRSLTDTEITEQYARTKSAKNNLV